jgi:hypothetical protein
MFQKSPQIITVDDILSGAIRYVSDINVVTKIVEKPKTEKLPVASNNGVVLCKELPSPIYTNKTATKVPLSITLGKTENTQKIEVVESRNTKSNILVTTIEDYPGANILWL